MPKKERRPDLSVDILEQIQHAALDNAASLLQEAKILFQHQKYARAYFLAVASIEEIGKSAIAFRARGRNLSDRGVQRRVYEEMESHNAKLAAAFVGWLNASPINEDKISKAVQLSIDLKRGREPTMYTDINDDGSLSLPLSIVKEGHAKDSISIAENCVHHMKNYLEGREPVKTLAYEDRILTISKEKQRKIMRLDDFSKFLLHEIKKGTASFDLFKSIVAYHDTYYAKGKTFVEGE